MFSWVKVRRLIQPVRNILLLGRNSVKVAENEDPGTEIHRKAVSLQSLDLG